MFNKLFRLQINRSSDKCVVLGNGVSVLSYKRNDIFTIGVNDICNYYVPNILFLVDTKEKFELRKLENRTLKIENANPDFFVVYDHNWNLPHEKTFKFDYGKHKAIENFENIDIIDTAYDSPYMATLLAAKLGFKKIGIIGVDYTDNHFDRNDGKHELIVHNKLQDVIASYDHLYKFLKEKNTEVYNLSKESKVNSLPYTDIETF